MGVGDCCFEVIRGSREELGSGGGQVSISDQLGFSFRSREDSAYCSSAKNHSVKISGSLRSAALSVVKNLQV